MSNEGLNQWGSFCIGLVTPLVFYAAVAWIDSVKRDDAEAQRAEPCVRSEQLSNAELGAYYQRQHIVLRKLGYTCFGNVCVNRDKRYTIKAPGY